MSDHYRIVGKPLSEPVSRLTAVLYVRQQDALLRLARQYNTSQSDLVRQAIDLLLAHQEPTHQ